MNKRKKTSVTWIVLSLIFYCFGAVVVVNAETLIGEVVYMWDFEGECDRWGPGPNLNSEFATENPFSGNYSAKYHGSYIYTTIASSQNKWGQYTGPGFQPMYPDTRYLIEGWIKIDTISSADFSNIDKDAKIVLQLGMRKKDGSTAQFLNSNHYDLTKMGTWQKMTIDCISHPEATQFYMRINTNSPNVIDSTKTVEIVLYLDDVSITEFRPAKELAISM